MSSSIYCRLIGHAIALGMHGINSISMFLAMHDEELLKDPQINTLVSLQNRYLTVWNVGIQIFYFSLAFACDFLTVSERDRLISKSIQNLRQIFFATFLWPATMIVFTIFWPFFLAVRELLYPAFIDKIFPFYNNFVIHFGIIPVMLWEAIFLPRLEPKSHKMHIGITSILFVSYVAFVLHTYSQRRVWPYPILMYTYGTIYFPILLLTTYILWIAFYFLQWKLTPLTGEIQKRKNKKANKKI